MLSIYSVPIHTAWTYDLFPFRHPSVHLSVRPSVRLSVCPSVRPSVCLSQKQPEVPKTKFGPTCFNTSSITNDYFLTNIRSSLTLRKRLYCTFLCVCTKFIRVILCTDCCLIEINWRRLDNDYRLLSSLDDNKRFRTSIFFVINFGIFDWSSRTGTNYKQGPYSLLPYLSWHALLHWWFHRAKYLDNSPPLREYLITLA